MRILIDTSIWIEYFKKQNLRLQSLILDNSVLTHEYIIIELALGTFRHREEILGYLNFLNKVPLCHSHEIQKLIDTKSLAGKGIGFVDVHLLASCLISGNIIWTLDKKLKAAAESVGIEIF